MRPRNVLTQTNNMRRLMGLPLLNEDTGETIKDVKKKVLTEDRSFSLGFGNQGGLTLGETTEAEETEEEGVGAPVNDVVEEQDEFGDGPLGIETGIDVGNPQPGDGEGGLGLNTDAQVFSEDSSYEDIRGEYDRLNKEYDSYDMDAMQGLGDYHKYNVDDRRRFRNLDNERNRISNLYYKMKEEDPMEENLAEGSFSKYNITLQDKMDLLREQYEVDANDEPAGPSEVIGNTYTFTDANGKEYEGTVVMVHSNEAIGVDFEEFGEKDISPEGCDASGKCTMWGSNSTFNSRIGGGFKQEELWNIFKEYLNINQEALKDAHGDFNWNVWTKKFN